MVEHRKWQIGGADFAPLGTAGFPVDGRGGGRVLSRFLFADTCSNAAPRPRRPAYHSQLSALLSKARYRWEEAAQGAAELARLSAPAEAGRSFLDRLSPPIPFITTGLGPPKTGPDNSDYGLKCPQKPR